MDTPQDNADGYEKSSVFYHLGQRETPLPQLMLIHGMDRRAIDWKHSARHRQLLAKEFRTERNHNIVFAFDTGRLMCEPLGGVPKIDRAINAALLLAYVSLRSGDKTALFGFDAKPTVTSNVLSGVGAFPHMRLTEEGEAIYAAVIPRALESERELLDALSEDEAATLHALLSRLSAVVSPEDPLWGDE